ncbi:hypothetical protein BDV12DRAFT_164039 [Aspergillus spectabilis]
MCGKLWLERQHPIQEAACNKHKGVVQYLLSNSETESTSTQTAANICLPDAADTSLVSFLLEHGADVNFQQIAKTISRHTENYLGELCHGPTALISAAKYGHTELVHFYLRVVLMLVGNRDFPTLDQRRCASQS